MHPHTIVILIAYVFCTVGCQSAEPWNEPGPEDTFESFLIHWFRGDAEQAFQMIAPDDREALTAEIGAVANLGIKPKPWEMLVVAEVENVYDVAKIVAKPSRFEERPADGTIVTLTVKHQDGSANEAQMVWREDRWYVDFPLQKAPQEKS